MSPRGEGGGGEWPGGCLRGIWGGGPKFFFFGAEIATKNRMRQFHAPPLGARQSEGFKWGMGWVVVGAAVFGAP